MEIGLLFLCLLFFVIIFFFIKKLGDKNELNSFYFLFVNYIRNIFLSYCIFFILFSVFRKSFSPIEFGFLLIYLGVMHLSSLTVFFNLINVSFNIFIKLVLFFLLPMISLFLIFIDCIRIYDFNHSLVFILLLLLSFFILQVIFFRKWLNCLQ